jgi:hypothetical protein
MSQLSTLVNLILKVSLPLPQPFNKVLSIIFDIPFIFFDDLYTFVKWNDNLPSFAQHTLFYSQS